MARSKEVTAAMRRIDEVTTAIGNAVERQGAATREISQNVRMAASGSQTLASSISTVKDAIDETNRSANHVRDASGKVSGAAELLTSEIREFFVRRRNGRWTAGKRAIKLRRFRAPRRSRQQRAGQGQQGDLIRRPAGQAALASGASPVR